ncbi:hypothetical protein ABID30_002593 [Enterococcus rotai]|uniref:Uncharacterized protein n=1 Tax=Enterococcus rotai TaxID=118060 RepID=A0A0U2XB14_9ENTE|nr:hypothetical protein [Enterococcus rotai]ALS37304.1 hypothetical protein ATZ35_09075 [Enterococcus rotai]
MKSNYLCEYQSNLFSLSQQEHEEQIKIIQLFVENGLIKIGTKTYPIVYGDVYFINAGEGYSIVEIEEELVQNTIMISADHVKELAKMLDFESEYYKIFEKKGHFHVASPHYKAIDRRFKEAFSVAAADKPFSKALFVSRVFELLNYAVVALEKRK